MNILVVGGGIFGISAALEAAKRGLDVTLVEQSTSMLQAASRTNHNRIHFGYHYPRCKKTAAQCLDSYLSFVSSFGNCIRTNFDNTYAIASEGSYITSNEFTEFCDTMRIGYRETSIPPTHVRPGLIDRAFAVTEPVFDYEVLRSNLLQRLESCSANVLTSTHPVAVTRDHIDRFEVKFNNDNIEYFDYVINCSYAATNEVASLFKVKPIDLRFEYTIVPVIEASIKSCGITIMDGPFCTVMPNGFSDNEMLLWHVDACVISTAKTLRELLPKALAGQENRDEIILNVMKKSSEFFPFLVGAESRKASFTVKAVVENKFDSRLTEYTAESNGKFFNILSGKIMTCCKIATEILDQIEFGEKRDIII